MTTRAERRRESKRVGKYGFNCRWPNCVSLLNRNVCLDNGGNWADCQRSAESEEQTNARTMVNQMRQMGAPEIAEVMEEMEKEDEQ